jgi:hypothetical protein
VCLLNGICIVNLTVFCFFSFRYASAKMGCDFVQTKYFHLAGQYSTFTVVSLFSNLSWICAEFDFTNILRYLKTGF